MSTSDGREDGAVDNSTAAAFASEPLACRTCRSRKLKCDRLKPICTRCAKAHIECVYPESRRKPAFKRRNVKELEARLAQVEGFLKEVRPGAPASEDRSPSDGPGDVPLSGEAAEGGGFSINFDFNEKYLEGLVSYDVQPDREPPELSADAVRGSDDGPPTQALIELGQFEALPPFEMIEDLHNIYFEKQHPAIPIIHRERYLTSFHSSPLLRPPMGLQYAIWAMAANGDDKYGSHHDVFYQRARHYMQVDEIKSYGEHFMTIAHAQAWALIATDEARCMYFTRAAMSGARYTRLVNMLGLHHLDDEDDDVEFTPTLVPPRDWIELEERRRVFWGAYCIDSHASISTGWPALINIDEVTTHLPSSEEAFRTGKVEKATVIGEAFNGASYSTFAAAIVVCNIFNRILKHVHRPKPSDRPADVEYGPFWKRHRELDNVLSSAFMFLPERFRLPQSLRDPVAVHTNLNLHASVICLHNAACDKADKHKLPASIKQPSLDRLLMSAQEIVNIMKLTSHLNLGYRSPLVALSLYCAASVYIYHFIENTEAAIGSIYIENLEFLLMCMEAIGRQHTITRSFLQQIRMDIEGNGLKLNIPALPWKFHAPVPCGHNIPLLARSSVSRHAVAQPPLPGRLPLGKPIGRAFEREDMKTSDWCAPSFLVHADERNIVELPTMAPYREDAATNKRKRTSRERPTPFFSKEPLDKPVAPNLSEKRASVDDVDFGIWFSPPTKTTPETASSSDAMSQDFTVSDPQAFSRCPPVPWMPVNLPHRTGSPATSSPSAAAPTPSTNDGDNTARSGDEPKQPASSTPRDRLPNINLHFQGLEPWDLTNVENMDTLVGFDARPSMESWTMLVEQGGLETGGETSMRRNGAG